MKDHPILVDNLQVVHGDAVDTTTTSSLRIDANIYCGDVEGLDNRPVQLDRSDVPIEWKTHCSKDHDPFTDVSQEFVCQTEVARDIQGELVNYADLIAKYQYRTHIFQLFLCGTTARFLRYDHAAAIVSESFNYITNSSPLVEFLQDQSQQKSHPVVSLTVSEHDKEKHTLLVWGHVRERDTIIGRGTRAFPVYDTKVNAIKFYKECWQTDQLTPETDTLRLLQDRGVPNVPTLCLGDSVPDHVTKSQDYLTSSWYQSF